MSEPRKCDDTSSEVIPNTSPPPPTAPADESDKKTNKKQKRQYGIESGEDATPERFQPFDLKLLTFKPTENGQEVDVWHAEPSLFHAYVSRYAAGFRNVNTDLWPLAERLALLNRMWAYASANHVPFPFHLRQQMEPDVNVEDVPDVNAIADTSASEAS